MRLYDFVVEEGRVEHIARHGVTIPEVEQALFGNPTIRRERNGYYRYVGQTDAGRYLTVILFPLGNRVGSLITARDVTTAERRSYRSQRGR